MTASGIFTWKLLSYFRIVRRNLSSALIVEDDVDWDIRLKPLLEDFAVSANALQQINSENGLIFNKLPSLAPPRLSAYGDAWDLLWLGHCGMRVGSGLVVHENDLTVPQPHYLKSFDVAEYTPLGVFPEHTRVIMRHQKGATCSLAYAITQASARQILHHLGFERLDAPYDLMLRGWCEGSATGGAVRTCIAVLPQLFDHHRRPGPGDIDSDISKPNKEYREHAYTLNIRWSVRMNMNKLLYGDTNYDDQYPDEPHQ
jgi:hypothetical protein